MALVELELRASVALADRRTVFIGPVPISGARTDNADFSPSILGGVAGRWMWPFAEDRQWTGLRVGAQVRGELYRKYSSVTAVLGSPDYSSAAHVGLGVPLLLGIEQAFGAMRRDGSWDGFIIGASYAPELEFELSSGNVAANPLRVEVRVDRATLVPAARLQGNLRFAATFQASFRDSPLAGSLGVGVAWY